MSDMQKKKMRAAVFVRFRDKACTCVIGGRKRFSIVFMQLNLKGSNLCCHILYTSIANALKIAAGDKFEPFY